MMQRKMAWCFMSCEGVAVFRNEGPFYEHFAHRQILEQTFEFVVLNFIVLVTLCTFT